MKHISGLLSLGLRGSFHDALGIEHRGGTYAEVILQYPMSTALVRMDDVAAQLGNDTAEAYGQAVETITTIVDQKLAADAGLKENDG